MTERDHISDRFYAEDKMTKESKTLPEELPIIDYNLIEWEYWQDTDGKYHKRWIGKGTDPFSARERFELAKAAMQTLCSNFHMKDYPEQARRRLCLEAWAWADAMLKARDEK